MVSPVVFRGSRASAEVVAGYLRERGVPLVEVIPPTPYPAGPLGHAFVRVEDPRHARHLIEEARLDQPLWDPPFREGVRLLAGFVLWNEIGSLFGFGVS